MRVEETAVQMDQKRPEKNDLDAQRAAVRVGMLASPLPHLAKKRRGGKLFNEAKDSCWNQEGLIEILVRTNIWGCKIQMLAILINSLNNSRKLFASTFKGSESHGL